MIFVASYLEGLLPIVPGDLATAFFAFLAARAGGLFPPTLVAVVTGSVGGALTLWYLGIRFGPTRLTHKIEAIGFQKTGEGMEAAEGKVEDAYRKYGWIALLVARMVPGVRAVVPAAAGVLRIPFGRSRRSSPPSPSSGTGRSPGSPSGWGPTGQWSRPL